MTRPIISDHCLLRFLERAGGLDVEGVRHALSASLQRAASVALDLSAREYAIRADGMVYIVVDNRVVTTYADKGGPAVKRPCW